MAGGLHPGLAPGPRGGALPLKKSDIFDCVLAFVDAIDQDGRGLPPFICPLLSGLFGFSGALHKTPVYYESGGGGDRLIGFFE